MFRVTTVVVVGIADGDARRGEPVQPGDIGRAIDMSNARIAILRIARVVEVPGVMTIRCSIRIMDTSDSKSAATAGRPRSGRG